MDDLVTALVAASPDAILVSNGTGRVLVANPAAEALTGFNHAELVGMPFADLADAVLASIVERTVHEASLPIDSLRLHDSSIKHRSGTLVPVEARVARLDVDHHPSAAVYLRPVTMASSHDELSAFRHMLDAVIADRDLPEVLDVAARAACELFGAHGASVARHTPDSDHVEVIAACGMLARYLGARVLLAGTRVQVALHTGVPVHFVSGGLLHQRASLPQGPDFGELWIAPLSVDGERFGALSVATPPGARLASDVDERLGRFVDVLDLAIEITEANRHRSVLAVVADQERIARDLHDVVIQRLIASAMRLESLSRQVDREVRHRLDIVIDDLDRVTRDIRATVFDLQRDSGAQLTVTREITDLAASTGDAFGMEVQCHVHGDDGDDLPEGLRANLLAATREALSNVGRHANASHVIVDVTVGDPLILVVTDDGCGVSPDAKPGNGLHNLAVRAEELRGSLTLRPGDNGGTVLTWETPWPARAGGEPASAAGL